jgi:hypothetical protein
MLTGADCLSGILRPPTFLYIIDNIITRSSCVYPK